MSDAARDHSRELYPFLHPPVADDGAALPALLAAARRSTLDKFAEIAALRREVMDEYDTQVADAATAMAGCFALGGKLVAFGNGGSATDADDAAADCLQPARRGWRVLPGLSLPADAATFSAVANDVGVEHTFARQLAALGDAGDIALAFSTSGQAVNVLAGLAIARRRGMLTVAMTGNDGGAIAREHLADFCFVARRAYIPRIQEAHATLWHALLATVQATLVAGTARVA